MAPLVRRLPLGPLDVVGDVHGELGALRALLDRLGYDEDGRHPEGRTLVFVGDLVDRGEDSPGVLRLVARLVAAGRAHCVLGNHELNLLLGKRRPGNAWFHGEDEETEHPEGRRVRLRQTLVTDPNRRRAILDFLAGLPLALHREDLRVVHACWAGDLLAALIDTDQGILELYHTAEAAIEDDLRRRGVPLDGLEADLARQNLNPVLACTSGFERPTAEPFHAGGRLRHAERVPWWRDYHDPTPVAFGHYWRRFDATPHRPGPDPFRSEDPQAPLGPRRNAWCLDYSVGTWNRARSRGEERGGGTGLVALRWPQRKLVPIRGSDFRETV